MGKFCKPKIPIAKSLYLHLLCVLKVHKKQWDYKKSAGHSEGNILSSSIFIGDKFDNILLVMCYLDLKPFTTPVLIPDLIAGNWIGISAAKCSQGDKRNTECKYSKILRDHTLTPIIGSLAFVFLRIRSMKDDNGMLRKHAEKLEVVSLAEEWRLANYRDQGVEEFPCR